MKMANHTVSDYEIILIPILAEIICEEVTDRVRELHFSAYRKLQASLRNAPQRSRYPISMNKLRITKKQNQINGGKKKSARRCSVIRRTL